MPSIQRPLSADALLLELRDELAVTRASLTPHGRSARTLIKDGPLRVTLIVLGPEGNVAEHAADGPITVQVLEGAVRFTVEGRDHELVQGQLLAVGPGVRHSVSSAQGGSFLLTVAHAS